MNGKGIRRGMLALALSGCCFSNVMATDSGAYIGINYGQSKINIDNGNSGFFDQLSSSSTDESDNTSTFALGYRFNPYVAVEANYNDYGKSTFSETGRTTISGRLLSGRLSGSGAAKGPAVVLTGTVPAGNWDWFGKIGLLAAKTEITGAFVGQTLTAPIQNLNIAVSESANTTETLVGVGFGYTFADHYHLKFEWIKIPKVGDEEKTGESDVTTLTGGFQYRF